MHYSDIKNKKRINLRQNFHYIKYQLTKWENVNFSSRDPNIKISGWLFNYPNDKPIVIVVHGLFPNGKCKS